MSLTPRHRWCVARISSAFEEVSEAEIQKFIRSASVLAEFSALFAGAGDRKLFIHYQPRAVSKSIKDEGNPKGNTKRGRCNDFLLDTLLRVLMEFADG
jgi:hypothetical protein